MKQQPNHSARQGRKAPKPHHAIRSLEVTGGFFKGLRIEFVDGLNCLIGGRGAGKTTAIELIRYALGLMPGDEAAPTRSGSLAELVQQNLGAGRVRLEVVTKYGTVYRVERAWGEAPTVLDAEGEPIGMCIGRESVFHADVYSHDEIEEIAVNPASQLVLLDTFIDEESARLGAEIRRIEEALAANGAVLARLEREIDERGEVASHLKAIEVELRALRVTTGPNAEQLNEAHAAKALREKERHTLEEVVSDVRDAKNRFAALLLSTSRRLGGRLDRDVCTGANKAVFHAVTDAVHELLAVLEGAARSVASGCEQADAALLRQQRLLTQAHAKQDAAYRVLADKSAEDASRATERARVQRRHLEATAARKELAAREKEHATCEREREELSAALGRLRDERFRLRKAVAERLSAALGPKIRVSVFHAGNHQRFAVLLTEALRGTISRPGSLVDKITGTLRPDEFTGLVRRGEVRKLQERTGLDEERARRVVDALRRTEPLYRIEVAELEDRPQIELLDGHYKDAASLSTGQRCTTILPILLLDSERPLVVDQPEDNLDNQFICETVVKSIEGAKGVRQLIFVTHNPNIPVLGDAERVFVLASDGRHGGIAHVGSVDELRKPIESLLEGGEEAFIERGRRYGVWPNGRR